MKKKAWWIGLLTVSFWLTACDPGSYQYDYNDLIENVVSIELINYDNPNQKSFISWVLPDHSSDLVPFEKSKTTQLEVLNEEKKEDFLKQLSNSDILYLYYAYDSPKGICIKLTYENGDFEIIWCDYEHKTFAGYIGRYTSEGEVEKFIGSFSSYDYFKSLVNDYFETNI